MKTRADGTVVWSLRDISESDRCPYAALKNYACRVEGTTPVAAISQPIAQLMGRALRDHRLRVEQFWRHNNPTIANWRDTDGARSLPDLLDGETSVLAPTIEWVDPDHGLLIEGGADALISHLDGAYEMEQARLGKSTMRRQLIELAGLHSGFTQLGVALSPTAVMNFAHKGRQRFELQDSWDAWRAACDGLAQAVGAYHQGELSLEWSTTPLDQCGRQSCAWCQIELSPHDDLFLIARLRRTHRRILRARGITTMTAFAEASSDEIDDVLAGADPVEVRSSHRQATLQVLTKRSGGGRPATSVVNSTRLATLNTPQPGDIYLDFEGDPAYHEWPDGSAWNPRAEGAQSWLGIDYLIGVMEGDSREYHSWWSSDFASEATAFRDFLDWIANRLSNYPTMSIYHYADYEATALRRLAERHADPRNVIAQIESGGTLVDLYRLVMASVAVGTSGYALKDLEALYFEPDTRSGISGGGESVLAFSRYLKATQSGNHTEARRISHTILDYNRLDTLSTRALHHWLLERRAIEETPH